MNAIPSRLAGLLSLLLPTMLVALGSTAAAAGEPSVIDLPTALRLAGASNLDVEIAKEKVQEARAVSESARARYLPTLTPSIGVRRHEGNIQAVNGPILDVDKQSLSAGLTLAVEIELGEVYYRDLAARQLERSSEAALVSRQREITYQAAAAYFELSRARAGVLATQETIRVARLHSEQIATTVDLGLTFAGDAARARAALSRAELQGVRVKAEQRIASARLAEILRLDPLVELMPADVELAPLAITPAESEVGSLVARALAQRSEVDEAAARLQAARVLRRGATVAPWVPTVSGQVQVGGLGGGPGGSTLTRDFDAGTDYAVGVSWRVGSGGLFDRSRVRESDSRQRQGELELEKVRDRIRREVVEQHASLNALAQQLAFARSTLESADQATKLSRQRRETGVSAVFEDLQAEDELARARHDYLVTVADYNLAQYALRYATGD